MAFHNGHPMGAIERAWGKVKNKFDWRGPVCATIPMDMGEVATTAITFYTGAAASVKFKADGKNAVVKSVGYRMGPCGP